MDRKAEILTILPVNKGVEIIFGDKLEVSIDCFQCQRKRRTVIFKVGDKLGVCTPTNHSFNGQITENSFQHSGNTFSARYEITYEYEEFTDKKYPDDMNYYGLSKGIPTWARVNFLVKCPKCNRTRESSTQNNIVRPFSQYCDCGFILYSESIEMPKLQWQET
jgi:hypothetical protein